MIGTLGVPKKRRKLTSDAPASITAKDQERNNKLIRPPRRRAKKRWREGEAQRPCGLEVYDDSRRRMRSPLTDHIR
jgi:hypothetical protein